MTPLKVGIGSPRQLVPLDALGLCKCALHFCFGWCFCCFFFFPSSEATRGQQLARVGRRLAAVVVADGRRLATVVVAIGRLAVAGEDGIKSEGLRRCNGLEVDYFRKKPTNLQIFKMLIFSSSHPRKQPFTLILLL